MPTHPSYHSYLLRLWQVKTDGEGWRVRLTQVDSGEEQLFTDLETLITFLRETVQTTTETGPTPPNDSLSHELAWARQKCQGEKIMWIHKTTVRLVRPQRESRKCPEIHHADSCTINFRCYESVSRKEK